MDDMLSFVSSFVSFCTLTACCTRQKLIVMVIMVCRSPVFKKYLFKTRACGSRLESSLASPWSKAMYPTSCGASTLVVVVVVVVLQ